MKKTKLITKIKGLNIDAEYPLLLKKETLEKLEKENQAHWINRAFNVYKAAHYVKHFIHKNDAFFIFGPNAQAYKIVKLYDGFVEISLTERYKMTTLKNIAMNMCSGLITKRKCSKSFL